MIAVVSDRDPYSQPHPTANTAVSPTVASSAGSNGGAAEPPGTPTGRSPRRMPRLGTFLVSLVLMVIALAGALLLPMPYIIEKPGPTIDTLGSYEHVKLITINDVKTYEETGQLRLTTVRSVGTPNTAPNLIGVIGAWISEDEALMPMEVLYPPDRSEESVQKESEAQMTTSQEDAVYAALVELGHDVPVKITVQTAVEDGPAVGVLKKGDVLRALDGKPITSYVQLVAELADMKPGTTVELTFTRDGKEMTESLTTGEKDGHAFLGGLFNVDYDLPVDIDIQLENVGGPSAGMMFALGIIASLTPEDETNGAVIAGTGTIAPDGAIGSIGGIAQKMVGARSGGAEWFLAPKANCAEVVGNIPDGLNVVSVSTLAEARKAMVAIGTGSAADLPQCTAG